METKKSCFICKNMPFCKHFDSLFNKINYSQFTHNTENVINTIAETIGQACVNYNQFQKDDTCKWKNNKNDDLYTIINPHNGLYWMKSEDIIFCQKCGKKIEVVE